MQARDYASSGTSTHDGIVDPVRRVRPADLAGADPQDRGAARHVASGVAKLGLVVRSEAWQARGRTGLTPTQAQILALLRAAEPDALTLRALAEGLSVSSATASESLDTLVGKGLAVRGRSSRDGRALAVRLTDAGRREAEAGGSFADALLDAAAELGGEEQAALLRGLTRMIHKLEDDGRIAPARMCASCRHFRPNAHPDAATGRHHCAYLDFDFDDQQLRIDCDEYASAEPDVARRTWDQFSG